MGSPYGVADSLRWLVRFVHPSTAVRGAVVPRPRAWRDPEHDPGGDLRVVFLGDLMASVSEGPVEATASLRERIASADLVVFNCESLVAERPFIGVLVFVMSQEFLERSFDALGIAPTNTVASLANNHIQDRGAAGRAEMIERLEGLGLTLIGLREDGRPPAVAVERRGLRLDLAAWTEWMNRDREPSQCSVWRPDTLDDLRLAIAGGARALIGFPHWDYEFCHFPSAATVARARQLLERGFSLIVGHHPHVLQPAELWQSGLCQYSLGNLTPMPGRVAHWATRISAILEVWLAGPSGREPGRVTGYELTPFYEVRSGSSLAFRTIEELPRTLRDKVERRVDLLFPPQGIAD